MQPFWQSATPNGQFNTVNQIVQLLVVAYWLILGECVTLSKCTIQNLEMRLHLTVCFWLPKAWLPSPFTSHLAFFSGSEASSQPQCPSNLQFAYCKWGRPGIEASIIDHACSYIAVIVTLYSLWTILYRYTFDKLLWTQKISLLCVEIALPNGSCNCFHWSTQVPPVADSPCTIP